MDVVTLVDDADEQVMSAKFDGSSMRKSRTHKLRRGCQTMWQNLSFVDSFGEFVGFCEDQIEQFVEF